jgi:hypothetical protein
MPGAEGGRDVFVLWIVGYLERRRYAKHSAGILVLRPGKFNTYLQNCMCFRPVVSPLEKPGRRVPEIPAAAPGAGMENHTS